MPETYRAPMRSRLDDIDAGLAQARAVALGLVGMGGRLDPSPGPDAGVEEVLSRTVVEHGERTARRVERFAAVPAGALVWTRDTDGRYRRGALTGPWRYDATRQAYAADLVHVRPCAWEDPLDEVEVPAAVVASFERGGRNFQRIRALDR
ncbi:GAF domain-containing protein [Nocardioides sp. dk4132]|uniref:GAF domain-containing protein n=1 Tax=unclassified Nocardioides TaxID=2615069 RepID=UPI0012979AFD|nr:MULTISPECIES: GAF domain-containing protein [unclassified Nocardioides]MQW75138.1 GAF domain-containing protein [Nocardioides sp. dk4132]QGA07696.1 GAF domain-containing protein [Nocardioides sp. dk884]